MAGSSFSELPEVQRGFTGAIPALPALPAREVGLVDGSYVSAVTKAQVKDPAGLVRAWTNLPPSKRSPSMLRAIGRPGRIFGFGGRAFLIFSRVSRGSMRIIASIRAGSMPLRQFFTVLAIGPLSRSFSPT